MENIKSRGDLLVLAANILALEIPECVQVHAEKMLHCGGMEYSRSFYEVAMQLMVLLVSGYSLEDGVRALAGRIQAVEDIPYKLKWGAPITTNKNHLETHAKRMIEDENDGPDTVLAKKILSKVATEEDWKMAALRSADVVLRVAVDNTDLPDFLDDVVRNDREFTELYQNLSRVTIRGDCLELYFPYFPPWTDTGFWDGVWGEAGLGYGAAFRPEVVVDPANHYSLPPGDNITVAKNTGLAHILAAATSSKHNVGATSALPQHGIEDDSHADTCNDQGKKATEYSKAKIAHAGKATDLTNYPKDNNTDLLIKDVIDLEWPSLPSNTAKNSSQPIGVEKIQNAWNNKQKKGFMNNGIADKHKKLVYSPPPNVDTDYIIDIARAYSIRDIWGIALLGQYVGRLPGHFAIQSMIKLWGVRVKYRIEEGWLIFNFEFEEDQNKVLIGGPYMIHGRPLMLKHVPDKFAFSNKDFATVPLWIRIQGLGTRFWTDEFLGGIASYVGKPLYLDPVTDGRKRNSYARVLVEINLAERVIRKVPIKFSDGESFICNIQIENEPKYCCECCALGHNMKECSFVETTAASKGLELRNGLLQKSAGINGYDDPGVLQKPDTIVKKRQPVSCVAGALSSSTAYVQRSVPGVHFASELAPPFATAGNTNAVMNTNVVAHKNDGFYTAGNVQDGDMVDTMEKEKTAVPEQENRVGKDSVSGVIEAIEGDARPQDCTKDDSLEAAVSTVNTHFVDKNRFSVLSTDEGALAVTTEAGIQSNTSDDVAFAYGSSKLLLTDMGPHTRSRVKGNKVASISTAKGQ